ncbi:hypothetical protein TRIUR3_24451 [Triticum urartu]|uniref:Uncharacterized protein n=1 Tax=Triticum urartu TaxID=4572 RepID=M7ZKL5_TRIUA|nr:hypothetical protein TRIUR3_24451 [Triticum urartu]
MGAKGQNARSGNDLLSTDLEEEENGEVNTSPNVATTSGSQLRCVKLSATNLKESFFADVGLAGVGYESFFSDVGLAGVGYEVTRYLYATSHISFPSFGIRKHNPSDDRMWSETGTFIGFVAVSTDEETARIGRRDIAVAWRGTGLGGELGVKALRILNVHDTVPKVPGVFTEAVLPMPLLRAADALGLPSVYSHIGVELALDHSLSPFLKNTLDLANYHNLEAHLHLLDGFVGRAREFKLGGRDPALVNKAADFLRDEHMVPPGWRQDANKGMVRSEDGRWVLPHRPRHVEDHPDDTDVHLAQLGLVPAS